MAMHDDLSLWWKQEAPNCFNGAKHVRDLKFLNMIVQIALMRPDTVSIPWIFSYIYNHGSQRRDKDQK